jgi:eukaryotic-like serine/threonine-protein kinase
VKNNVSEWIGQEIAESRYKILGRIGHGSMGHIFCAFDRNLQTDVVLKFPVANELAAGDNDFHERFAREIRSLVTLSHPHIVKVIDVGEFQGLPFVVMQYLAGGSLKDRMASGPAGEIEPMPLPSLRDWLLEIAKALDFIHSQHYIHRDVKPANILFDRHGNPFLGDFGIIKALTSESADWKGNAVTAPGFLVGTPNYVAPEVVMGRPFDGRVDQYSLAMSIYEVLTGHNCMEGPTPSATVVNQTMVVPPPLSEILPGVSSRMSEAILRGLSKNPGERFETCTVMAEEIISAVPSSQPSSAGASCGPRTSRGEPGKVPCPYCGSLMPAGREHVGSRLRCTRCQSVSLVQMLSMSTLQLNLIDWPASAVTTAGTIVVHGPDGERESGPAAATALLELPARVPTARSDLTRRDQRATTRRLGLWLAASVLGLLVIAGAVGLARALRNSASRRAAEGGAAPRGLGDNSKAGERASGAAALEAKPVEIHIAFGTEKQRWLDEVTGEFQKTPEGRRMIIKLHGMGSVEGAQAVLEGPEPIPIHVWSPASSAYRDLFEQEWRAKHKNNPILRSENLALTPMVFVTWESRHAPFLKKYAKVNFQTVGQAMREPNGWESIGGQPGWGRFKFGHTHPNRSNSGLLTLVLMAYEYSKKEHNLSLDDIGQPGFLQWLKEFEPGVARPGGSLSHSTGTLMVDMVLRGPSQYDCLLIYENLAIDYLEAARDRWGELHVDYPEPNMWNEHPYYILDVPWSDGAQRAAAAEYLTFLMSEPMQRRALEHGFRPGNPEVSVRFAESPLIRHAQQGIRIELPRMCEPPRADIVKSLLVTYGRLE